MFLEIQLQCLRFDHVVVYLMASKIMQGKVHVPDHASTEATQADEGISSSLVVEEDGSRVQATDVVEEALRHWKGWKKDSPTL